MVGPGTARRGRAWPGKARLAHCRFYGGGNSWPTGRGVAWQGLARQGRGQGLAWQGMATSLRIPLIGVRNSLLNLFNPVREIVSSVIWA